MKLSSLKKILPREVYEACQKKYKNALRAPSIRPADLERAFGDGPVAAQKNARFTSPVSISIYSERKVLTDADGISAKAVIDGLVHCGILSDDTTAQIKEIHFYQRKIGRKRKYAHKNIRDRKGER